MTVGVEVSEQVRGHEEGCVQAMFQGKSKVASIDALEPHMVMLETSMPVVQDTLDILELKVDGLMGEYGEFAVTTKALIQD